MKSNFELPDYLLVMFFTALTILSFVSLHLINNEKDERGEVPNGSR